MMALAGALGAEARPFTKVECYQSGLSICPETTIRTVEVSLCDACGVVIDIQACGDKEYFRIGPSGLSWNTPKHRVDLCQDCVSKILIVGVNVIKAREHRGEYNVSWDQLFNLESFRWPVPDPPNRCPLCGDVCK